MIVFPDIGGTLSAARSLSVRIASMLRMPCLGFEFDSGIAVSSLEDLSRRWAVNLATWIESNCFNPPDLFLVGYSYGARIAYYVASLFEQTELCHRTLTR